MKAFEIKGLAIKAVYFALIATVAATAKLALAQDDTAASAEALVAGQAAYSSKGCIACHGNAGLSVVPAYPSLAGKDAAYLKQQLVAFKTGARTDPNMNIFAGLLSDVDIDHVAAYLGAQQVPASEGSEGESRGSMHQGTMPHGTMHQSRGHQSRGHRGRGQ